MKSSVGWWVLLAVLPGCSPALQGDSSAPAIEAPASQVRVALTDRGFLEGRFTYRYTNRHDFEVFVPTCGSHRSPDLEKQVDGDWVFSFGPAFPLCLGTPLVIPGGSTRELEYHLIAGPPNSRIAPQFKVAGIDGTYRLVWEIFGTRLPDDRLVDLLPLEERVSNGFSLVLEQGGIR